METTNLPQSSVSVNLPTSSLTSQDKILMAIAQFGDEYRELIFNKYQRPTSIEKAVEEKSPNFHEVTNFWGEKATLFWLRFHIAETFNFLGIYDTASKHQVQQTAEMIISHEIFGQLTLSEFLCFLQRFKQGRYGKIYQSSRPNPQEFLMCLQPFWNELSYERGRKEERDRLERLSEAKKNYRPPTPEETDKIKNIVGKLSKRFVLK